MAVAAVAVACVSALPALSSPAPTAAEPVPASTASPDAGSPARSSTPATPEPDAGQPAEPAPEARRARRTVPRSGPGTFRHARLAIEPPTVRGRLIRYDVRIEKNLALDPKTEARRIARILNDERSWRGTGQWRFELVSRAQDADVHAYIATPQTTDQLCAPWRTRGEVSCQNGNRVVLNAKRWIRGAPAYRGDLKNYRRYLVNHEFGHTLGKQHQLCPGRGRTAPVMMQQTKGLRGCTANPWPSHDND